MLPWIALACFCALPLVAAGEAIGATLTNLDAAPFVFTVTENQSRTEMTVRKGQTINFCLEGCFVALPNGDRAALTGNEAIEISGGRIKAR